MVGSTTSTGTTTSKAGAHGTVTSSSSSSSSTSRRSTPHSAVVLFYKYFVPSQCPPIFSQHDEFYVDQLNKFQRDLCSKLHLKGRILLATEGINGTLSACSQSVLEEYITAMQDLDVIRGDLGFPPDFLKEERGEKEEENNYQCCRATPNIDILEDGRQQLQQQGRRLFDNVDWKFSSTVDINDDVVEPFPDLKISLVKEIVSTGGVVPVQNVTSEMAGRHLSPEEFHNILVNSRHPQPQGKEEEQQQDGNKSNNNNDDNDNNNKKEIVLIDVRNTFEYDIGHFILPHTGESAMNPEMVTFSSFDQTFCSKHADSFKDKKVLMYCTGGIRCEKASVMLKQRGVEDVNQLQGGIHRYLEQYGNEGCFKGLNFVFDQRVAMKPPPPATTTTAQPPQNQTSSEDTVRQKEKQSSSSHHVVGRCIECQAPFDEICGSRICTVCRDLVLVCHTCQDRPSLREYHCRRHSSWKDCYFTFLEVFDATELHKQRQHLEALRNTLLSQKQHKNTRRTLLRQIEKVTNRIARLEVGEVVVDREAPQRCRTCSEPNNICDGRCWGFWKAQQQQQQQQQQASFMAQNSSTVRQEGKDTDARIDTSIPPPPPIEPVSIGDQVEPGLHWNTVRLGEKTIHSSSSPNNGGVIKRGTVVEIKSWAGNEQNDCVAVLWNNVDEFFSMATVTASDDIHENVDSNVVTAAAGITNKKTTLRSRNQAKVQPQIYRWGVLARDGITRMYDVQKQQE